MTLFFWITGLLLAVLWLDRDRDAYTGMATLADISQPEWDLIPATDSGAPSFGPSLAEDGDLLAAAAPFRPGVSLSGGVSELRENSQGERIPRLCVIVPARNEELKVEASLRTLLNLEYPDYEVIAIDDRSIDSTGEILDGIAGSHSGNPALRVLHISELPSGWLGKPHAMWLAAQKTTADWILFTDADVGFRSDCLRRAIAYGEASRADHVVLVPTYLAPSFGERLMLSGFAMLFLWGHRAWKVADPKADDWTGLGPFNLIRRDAYEKIGTFRALRMEVIEDMKLGKLVKQHGLAQRMVLGPGLLPWQWGRGAFGIVRNLTKNMFASMQFRWERAIGGSFLFCFLNFMPFLGLWLAPSWAKLPYAIAIAAMAALYSGLSRLMRVSALWVVLHPVSSLLLLYTMARSMAHAARHRGVIWRGTWYSLKDLRKGLV
jgi:cellulose synthase/poly-beta-1,6-N-acetylglucosamine synthase-like glycosyltransferase